MLLRIDYIRLRDGHVGFVKVDFGVMADDYPLPDSSHPQFPSHNEPRVWVITAGDSPIGISLTRQSLAHGDYVLAGLAYSNLERDECRREGFEAFMVEVEAKGWTGRLKSIPLDIRCGFNSFRENVQGTLWTENCANIG